MSIIHPFCINLKDVISIVTSNDQWRLPEDVYQKAKNDSINFNDDEIPNNLKEFNIVHYVALLNASSFFLVQQGEKDAIISLSILKIANSIKKIISNEPEIVFKTDPKFDDSEFSNLLIDAFKSKLQLTESEIENFKKPFITASLTIVLAGLGEKIIDYAAISKCYSIESAAVSEQIATDQFTRENSTLYVSHAAQRLTDITTNSKLLKKKKGDDSLNKLPEIFAPFLAATAAIKTSIAKPLHFYNLITLNTNLRNLLDAAKIVLACITTENIQVTKENILLIIYNELVKLFNDSKNIVDEETKKGRKFYFGLITTAFSNEIREKGPSFLTTLPTYKLQQVKKAICKEPVGTRDLLPENMCIRELVTGIVTKIFKKHGAVTIDTPVFELREVLTEKYGEESKLIYNLEDQGGELLSLRYDLTVPFARFVATHGINSIKRYHIAKVYRRDKPAIERGRFREFYQCDFDIAGQSSPMIADSEVISIFHEILSSIGKLCNFDFIIYVSHRQLLSAMTTVAKVPSEKFKTICSSIDKLDKQPWEEVRNELVKVKGLSDESADKLWEYLQLSGNPIQVLESLRKKEEFVNIAKNTLDEMELLFRYLSDLNVIDKVVFNMSLARGLDYYTGVILEAVAVDETTEVKVGSIAGGGRYDDLIGMFSGKKIPAVGASLGIERVFALIEKKMKNNRPREVDTRVMVCSIAKDYTDERLKIASELWKEGIPTEFNYKAKPDIKAQLGQADKMKIDLAVIIAPEEMEVGNIKIKNTSSKEEIIIKRDQLVPKIKDLLSQIDNIAK